MAYSKNSIQNIWGHIQLYNLYRLIVAGVLSLISLNELTLIHTVTHNNAINITISTYTIIVIIGNILCYAEWPNHHKQIYFSSIIDISALLIIISISDGVDFGIGVLIILPILIPNLLIPSRYSLLLTLMSVILLLLIEGLKQSPEFSHTDRIFHSTALAFFILLASWLSTKWASSTLKIARLANRQRVDLANLSELNQTILDKLPTGIIVTDDGKTIRHMNSTAHAILGKPEHWYKKPIELYAPELHDRLTDWYHNNRPLSSSYDINHQSSTTLRINCVQLGSAISSSALIYLNDTHEEREHLQDMKLASLGQLTANIAHEIRNPLGAISHAAQLLSESEYLDQADRRLVQIIQDNSKRMNLTIENVLNLSRRKNPKREEINLRQWLKTFINDFVPQNKLMSQQITLFIEPSDITISFDPNHLHQIMWNLCRNAVKHAHIAPDKLQLLVQGGIPNYTRDVVLSIIDNGSGLTKKQLERLFEPFYTTNTQGTGLGLFMSRELCHANGASLNYIEIASGGSCFRINFTHV